MQTYYVNKEEYDKKLKTNEYSELHYFSEKGLKKAYPKGGYILVGGIGEGMKEVAGTFQLTDEVHDYYTLHYSKFHYGIVGYVNVGEDIFLAIVKNRLSKSLLYLFLMLALLSGLTFGAVTLFNRNANIDPNAKDFTPSVKLNVKADPNHIALPGYGDLKMEADTNVAYVALWNPPENPCYFKFKITMRDSEKVLYESKLIAPGKAITELKFEEPMKSGIYDITIRIDTFSLKDEEVAMNGGDINTRIISIKRN